MAETKLAFELGSSLATQVLTDAKYVKGSYITVQTVDERNALVTGARAKQEVLTNGTPVYVASENKTYRFKTSDKSWVLDESSGAGSSAWKWVGEFETPDAVVAAKDTLAVGNTFIISFTDSTKAVSDGKMYFISAMDPFKYKLTSGWTPEKTSELENTGDGSYAIHYYVSLVTAETFDAKVATGLYTRTKAGEYTKVESGATFSKTTTYYEKTDSSTVDKYATRAYVDNELAAIVASAPAAFDTLKEIADWIQDDKSGAAAMANAIAKKVDKLEDGKGPTAGTYTKLTINAQGLVTKGESPTTLSGYGITDASIDTTNKKITLGTNELTVLTEHPTITITADTTAAVTPAHGETISYVSEITRDTNGHVTTIKTTTATLPAFSYDATTKTLTIV